MDSNILLSKKRLLHICSDLIVGTGKTRDKSIGRINNLEFKLIKVARDDVIPYLQISDSITSSDYLPTQNIHREDLILPGFLDKLNKSLDPNILRNKRLQALFPTFECMNKICSMCVELPYAVTLSYMQILRDAEELPVITPLFYYYIGKNMTVDYWMLAVNDKYWSPNNNVTPRIIVDKAIAPGDKSPINILGELKNFILTLTDIEQVVYYQGIIEKAEEINKYLESVYGPD